MKVSILPGEEVTELELRFIEALLGPARGNVPAAGRIVGIKQPQAHAHRMLNRPRVRRAIERHLAVRAAKAGIDKDMLVAEALMVMKAGEKFERLKAIDLLAKLLGYFAPRRSIRETAITGGQVAYGELLQTLRTEGERLTSEEAAQLRGQIVEDMRLAGECLAVLDQGAVTH